MANIGTLSVKLVADLKKFAAGMKLAAGKAKDFAASVSRSMKSAAAAIVRFAASAARSLAAFVSKWLKRAAIAVLAFGVASVKMASDVTEGENLVRESFKEMTDSVTAWSKQMQKDLGLNAFKLREQAGLLNLLTKSMGLTAEQAFLLSTSITEVSVHVASLRNQKFDVTLEKMRSGLLGMPRPLKDIGINIDEMAIKQLLWKENIDATVGSLTGAQKIMARYILILQQTQTDVGDLARTSDDLQNVMRVIKEQVTILMEELGAKLLPVITEVAIAMRNWLMDNREDIVAWFGMAVGKFGAFIQFLRADFKQGFQGSLEIMAIIADATGDAIVAIFKAKFMDVGKNIGVWIFSGWKRGLDRNVRFFKSIASKAKEAVFGGGDLPDATTGDFKDLPTAAEDLTNMDLIWLKMTTDINAAVAGVNEFAATVGKSEEELAALEEKRLARTAKLTKLSEAARAKRLADLKSMMEQFRESVKTSQVAEKEITESFVHVGNTIVRVMDQSKNAVTDAFVGMLETMAVEMDNFEATVKKFFVAIAQEIARMQARLIAARILGSTESGGAGGSGLIEQGIKFFAGALGGSGAQAKARGGIVKPVFAAKGFAPRGSDTVPAMLTPGEGVLSKGLTQALREQLAVPGGMGGAPPVTIQVQTIDSQSTAQWLNTNKRLIAGMLNETRNGNNPSSRRFAGQRR